MVLAAISLFGSWSLAQPAIPPAPHVEAVGTHVTDSDTVGATPGEFRVDEGGAASYSLPIMALPGTAGLTPKFSLDYSARGAAGALGTGFVFSGQSAFARCKKSSEAGDGVGPHAGVDYSDTENVSYCLDGQRIFAVTDSCPGLSGVASVGRPFRSELDPATRICGYSRVSATGETDFWLVFPKDGSLRRYGYGTGSALRPNDGLGNALSAGYVVQALDRIADATGNTIDFEYNANVQTGELLLSAARYTGKVANRLQMDAPYTRPPFARTVLQYEPMPLDSQRVDYAGGSRMALTQRLASIQVFGPANHGANPMQEVQARRYALSYRTAATGSRMSRLVAVQECAPGASAATDVCYPPTRFSWNNAQDNDFPEGFFAPSTSTSYSSQLAIASDLRTADINGDGRQDVVFLRDRNCALAGSARVLDAQSEQRFQLMIALSQDSGVAAPVATQVFLTRKPQNGGTGASAYTWRYSSCVNNAAGAVKLERVITSSNIVDSTRQLFWSQIWHTFDLTGDGRDDLIAQRRKTVSGTPGYGVFVHATSRDPSTQAWLFDATGSDLFIDVLYDRDTAFADVTGDGLPDLMLGNAQNLDVVALERMPVGSGSALAYRFEQIVVNNQPQTRLRSVTTVGFETLSTLSFGGGGGPRLGDLDGDGAADLVLSVTKTRVGFVCSGTACVPCGATNEPECDDTFGCPGVSSGICSSNLPPLLELSGKPIWRTAAEQTATLEVARQSGTDNRVGYWVTARMRQDQQGNFNLIAEQCSAGGPTNRCNNDITLDSSALIDLNGDGQADWWMQRKHSSSTNTDLVYDFRYRLNSGGGVQRVLGEESTGLVLKAKFAAQLQLLDITGDRRVDLVYPCKNTTGFVGESCAVTGTGAYSLRAKIWNSGGYFSDISAATGTLSTLNSQNPDDYLSLALDLGGDGAVDFLRYKVANPGASNNLYVLNSRLRFGGSDVIVNFRNGLGVDHAVTYVPLTSPYAYERAFDGPLQFWGRGGVVLDVFGPMWVVREACSSSPGVPVVPGQICTANVQSDMSIVRYSYRGGRVQTGGRGFLGFASIRTEDVQNQLVTTTDYRQDYPFLGRASRTTVEKRAALIPDPCLADPTAPECYEEPPDNCGGGICPVVEGQQARQLLESTPHRFAPLRTPNSCVFTAPAMPVITDSSSCMTSTPSFIPAQQRPILVFADVNEERRYDPATLQSVHRVKTDIVVDQMGNLTSQRTETFDQDEVPIEISGVVNFYGCTEAPIELVKGSGGGCISSNNPDPERLRLGRLSLAGSYSVRDGVSTFRRSAFEYDPNTLLLHAEVVGLYNYGNSTTEPPLSEKPHMHSRTDYVLDANGNRTLSVSCSVDNYPNRQACLNLAGFQQQQWSSTPTRFQRYVRTDYDSLGRFVQNTRAPYFVVGNPAGIEASSGRTGVDSSGVDLNRNVYGDPLGALSAHGVYAQTAYGSMGRAYFSHVASGAFSRTRYAWCVDAATTTLPDGSGGIPVTASRVNCPLGAVYRVETNSSVDAQNAVSIAPRSFSYFDKLGRAVLSTTRVYQSAEEDPNEQRRWSSSWQRYDSLGRVLEQSEPYFSVDPTVAQSTARAGALGQGVSAPATTLTSFDEIGRSTRVDIPTDVGLGTSFTTASFDRMRTATTDPRGFDVAVDKNGLAEAKRATDQYQFAVDYERTTFGNLKSIRRTPSDGDSANQIIATTIAHDALGRVKTVIDPDRGANLMVYNALGEVLSTTDGKGQTTQYRYDALGRIVVRIEQRLDALGQLVPEQTTTWEFDNATLGGSGMLGLGLLRREANDRSMLTGLGGYERVMEFDQFGRPVQVRTRIEGVDYWQRQTYDAFGRMFQAFAAATSVSSNEGVLAQYSDDGFPIREREAANDVVGQIYREPLASDARGQVQKERLHDTAGLTTTRTFDSNTGRLLGIQTGSNGLLQHWTLKYDKNGNLTERWNRSGNGSGQLDLREQFAYDNLNRLDGVSLVTPSGTVSTMGLDYDALGNIISKSGAENLGAYRYRQPPAQTGCVANAGPHALSQAGNRSYCYDANGNATQIREGGSVVLAMAYTGYDRVAEIDSQTTTMRERFRYAPDRSLMVREVRVGGQLDSRVVYVGDSEFWSGPLTKRVRHVGGYLTITHRAGTTTRLDYVLRDHLGTVEVLADETGQLRSRRSFDAHGKRRAVVPSGSAWVSLSPLQQLELADETVTEGYGGHRQLDRFGLVHMGARLYDPTTGRFLQADVYTEPEATQGLNRYSYVVNNPLTHTDPTGQLSLRQALGIVVGVAAAIISGGASLTLMQSFLVAVSGGFASAAIATGSLKAGLWGALSAAVFFGIGSAFENAARANSAAVASKTMEASKLLKSGLTSGQTIAKIAAHAGAGGTLNVLQGGKFGHGFLSAGFTEALSPAVGQIGEGRDFGTVLAKTVASAAIGGTTSVLAGGKFGNGAATGAFQELFNRTLHPDSKPAEDYPEEHVIPAAENLSDLLKGKDTFGENHNCVDLIKGLVPEATPPWEAGRKITYPMQIEPGTVIFTPGHMLNGRGHAAVFLRFSEGGTGIIVMDQGPGLHTVLVKTPTGYLKVPRIGERIIPFNSTTAAAQRFPIANQAKYFYTLRKRQ